MEFLKIGKIVNTHGIKGEVKIYPYTDDLDNFLSYKTIYLDEALSIKRKIKYSKVHKNMIIAKLENINSIEETKLVMNNYIYVVKPKIKDEDIFYVEDLIGLELYEVDKSLDYSKANFFGVLKDILKPGANDVYEVMHNNSLVYLPVIKDVVKKIDLDSGKIYVEIMEGLI